MIVPSHFIPLAAPGTVAMGLKWLWNRESPFALSPRFSLNLARWGFNFWQASTPGRVQAAAPLLCQLHLASRALYVQLQQQPNMDFGLVQRGLLMLCRTQEALDTEARVAEKAHRLGLAAEVLDARQTTALEPGIDLCILGSIHFPQDCHLVPEVFMDNLQRAVENAGGQFAWNTRVQSLRHQSGRILALETTRGPVDGDRFVISSGVWSPRLTQQLDLRLPLEAGKGYSLTLPQPRQLPRLCSILTEARVAVTPMGQTLRVGGTLELTRANTRINPNRIRGITRAVAAYYPAFGPEDFTGLPIWTGLRPLSPDGMPYLGIPRRWPNLIVATGHAMMGLSLGPVTGQLVAELASGERPSFDLSLLDVDRYG